MNDLPEFDVIGHVRDAMDYPNTLSGLADAWRTTWADHSDLSVPYGAHKRQKYDLFHPLVSPRGVMVFIHGGYWQYLSRRFYSHLAAPFVQAGWAVAMPSYRLAPEVSVATIFEDVLDAVTTCAAAVRDGPMRIFGHSAGGHLSLCLAAADLPTPLASRLDHVCAVSPVTDMRPFLSAKVGKTLGLTEADVLALSPLLHDAPPGLSGRIWLGAEELPSFYTHASGLAERWNWPLHVLPGRNHFDVTEPLADPGSAMARNLLTV